MILVDRDIINAMAAGEIDIDPFDKDHLGANSYDVQLSKELLVYTRARDGELDMRKENPTKKIVIPKEGFVLQPGVLYLGSTVEWVGTKRRYVPHIEGRSSCGRLGLGVHVTAGFGDMGFGGKWTLELTVVHPLRVYANERVAQAYFLLGSSAADHMYDGKYHGRRFPVASRMYLDQRNSVDE
jgi:dCTP deaminase